MQMAIVGLKAILVFVINLFALSNKYCIDVGVKLNKIQTVRHKLDSVETHSANTKAPWASFTLNINELKPEDVN